MSNVLYAIEPYDTVAFRDGRPFEQGDQGLAETVGVFPPPPPAVSGAVKVAVAAAIGIAPSRPGRFDWARQAEGLVRSSVADDQARGRQLSALLDAPVAGPFIIDRLPGPPIAFEDVLVPCPLSLLFPGDHDMGPAAVGVLVPATAQNAGQTNTASAGTTSRMLERRAFQGHNVGDKSEQGAGYWMRLGALRAHLRDPVHNRPDPSHCRRTSALMTTEQHIGIAVDKTTGRVVNGQLYAASHQRLQKKAGRGDPNRILALMAAVSDPNPDVDVIVPLGGEGRFARVTSLAPIPAGQRGPRIVGNRLCLVALTPVPFDAARPFGVALPTSGPLAAFRVVAACHERPVSLGFIDQRDDGRRRSRIIKAFAAGSTWFLQAAASRNNQSGLSVGIAEERLAADDLTCLGFGVFAIGNWT